jgi:hypothetical protein
MAIIIPLAAAVIGAIAAALVTQFVRRPKPAVIIDELSRSPDVTPHRAGAVPNLDLSAACADSEFISTELFLARPDERIGEKKYVERIHAILDQAEIASEGLPAITTAARALNDCLQRSDHAAFRSTFSREFQRLWPSLIVGYVRGKFSYQSPGPSPLGGEANHSQQSIEGTEPQSSINHPLAQCQGVESRSNVESRSMEFAHPDWEHIIIQDMEGEFFIPMPGPRNMVFPWRFVSAAQLVRAQAFALRTAVSFASSYRQDLQEVTNFLLTVEEENRALLESLQAQLEEELKLYERIVVKGFIANSGGSPVTVTNSAKLFIQLAGYSFTDHDRALKSLAGDREIEMVVGADREEVDPAFDSAITVPGGSVARFAATSKKRIQDLPDPRILVRAMTGGERKCYLGTMTVSQSRSRFRRSRSRPRLGPAYTEPQPFRDSATEVQVPRRERSRLEKVTQYFAG